MTKAERQEEAARRQELLERGAEFILREDRHGDTFRGWWIDEIYLGKTTRNALENIKA
jgi:hypothetical protein